MLAGLLEFLQLRKNRLSIQPLSVVGIAVSEHDFSMRIHNIDRRDWQCAVLLSGRFFKKAWSTKRPCRIDVDFSKLQKCLACLLEKISRISDLQKS